MRVIANALVAVTRAAAVALSQNGRRGDWDCGEDGVDDSAGADGRDDMVTLVALQ